MAPLDLLRLQSRHVRPHRTPHRPRCHPSNPTQQTPRPRADKAEAQEPNDESIILFSCVEQFLIYCKAGCFHDIDTQWRILASNDPKEQKKKLGKATKGFVDSVWDEVKSDVVVVGNMAKFGQNSRLRALLLGTGERDLCEAASHDRVWGIGYTAGKAMGHHRDWGENRLGRALMEVMARLREVEGREGVNTEARLGGVEGGQELHIEERDGDGLDGVTAGPGQQLDKRQDGAEGKEWAGESLSKEKLVGREA